MTGSHPLQDRHAFRQARDTLGLSTQGMADALHLGAHGGRTVRRWEAGDSDVPGPAAVAVGLWLAADCPPRLRPPPRKATD